MGDILRVTMVNGLEQRFHVAGRLRLSEGLVLLLANLLEKRHTWDELHYQVDIFRIVICFIVLDDVRMIKPMQSLYLLHDHVYRHIIFRRFFFI